SSDVCSSDLAPVEALPAPHSGGKNRSNQRTDVNAHIEDGETTITAWISLGVQRAEHNLRGSFHATGTNGNQNKTDAQTRNSRNYCQSNVAQHDHYGRVEQGAF